MSCIFQRNQKIVTTTRIAFAVSLCIVLMGSMPGKVQADDYFNPALLDLENPDQGKTDFSVFEKDDAQAPGTYHVNIYINNESVDTRDIVFSLSEKDNSTLQPCFSREMLEEFGVKEDALPKNEATDKCVYITQIPDASAEFKFNEQKLMVSIPQLLLKHVPRGYVSPDQYDEGINAALLNYSFSGSKSTGLNEQAQDNTNYFLNLRPGLNLGAWRLRNYSTWNQNSNENGNKEDDFSSVYTYAQRDIIALKSQLTLGQSSSPSDVFDSVSFTGAQLASDDDMLPDSMKGFAPLIHGIARSNAQVTVRQNGYVIYQSYVSPGAFEINDMYPTGSSGDLNVTVKESDGSEQNFVVPYASLPVLQREGHLKYSITAGQYRSYNDDVTPSPFLQGTAMYGLKGGWTVYGGLQGSSHYSALSMGVGKNFGSFGALSLDVDHAKSTLKDEAEQTGNSWRLRYSKDFATTGTTVAVAGYRYSTAGFYSLQDVMDSYTDDSDDTLNDHRSQRQEITINQKISPTLGSLSISAVKEQYWNSDKSMASLSLGYNNSWNGISYGINYSYNKNTNNNDDDNDHEENDYDNDKVLSFNVSIPLDRWLKNTYVNYSLNNSKESGTTHNIGISGSALEGNNLSWNIQQGLSAQGDNNSTTLNADYKGTYGELTAGYSQDQNQRQINYGVQGGIVAHANGVTFSQPLGETIALIKAPGIEGVGVNNQTGVKTDFRGYTVVPYVSPYHKTALSLNTQMLADDADLTMASQSVTPTRGAVVRASYDTRIGKRVLMMLTRSNQHPVPFGASVTIADTKDTEEFIVGDDGQVYLTGLEDEGSLLVSWGKGADKQCHVNYQLPKTAAQDIPTINATCQ